jgi:phosphoglycerate kinase
VYSLEPVAERLAELLSSDVEFVADPIGRGQPLSADLVMLENTRFLSGEIDNAPDLAKSWAELGDLFVNDAFGAAHRAHASTAGLADAMRGKGGEAVAGLLMARELHFLGRAMGEPRRPFVGILGGAKISGKIDVISSLLQRVDRLLIGGAMANTFFQAMGLSTGVSLVEDDRVPVVRDLLQESGDKLLLPVDCIVAKELREGAPHRVVASTAVRHDDMVLDIGPETATTFGNVIDSAHTILWNGPMGVFETPPFGVGTIDLAHSVANVCDRGALVVVGGGDSAMAVDLAGVTSRLTHVSSGGGASLAFLAGKTLPGVHSLSDKE